MSERFVRGFEVRLDALEALRPTLDAGAILRSDANARCLEDVFHTVGEGDRDAGERAALQGLEDMIHGRTDATQRAVYARLTELVLGHHGTPLAAEYVDDFAEPVDQILLQLTYAVPNDSHGRWNPLLEAAGFVLWAQAWAKPSFTHLWSRDEPPEYAWPVWTVIRAHALAALHAELEGDLAARIAKLPAALLSDASERVRATREELVVQLVRLRGWVERVLEAPEADLVLFMDGDQ